MKYIFTLYRITKNCFFDNKNISNLFLVLLPNLLNIEQLQIIIENYLNLVLRKIWNLFRIINYFYVQRSIAENVVETRFVEENFLLNFHSSILDRYVPPV